MVKTQVFYLNIKWDNLIKNLIAKIKLISKL